MELSALIAALSDPAAYPGAPETIEVRHTHISAVFLAGPFVYKVKKPVDLGFLDFSTLEKRHHFCQEELRLNLRLAADVYLAVVPIVRTDSGGVRVEGAGEVVEWAVKMRRLADEATLESRLDRGEPLESTLAALARKIAEFHAAAERGPHVAAFGRFEVVAGNARENLVEAERQIGTGISRAVLDRLLVLTEAALNDHRALIERRAKRLVPCDTHGDLRLGHVYVLPDRRPPADLVVIDCIEFNERFRFADPVADVAFLAMGLEFHGRRDLARMFIEAYFLHAHDDQGQALLGLYTAYRAAVRGKVEGLKATRAEVPPEQRAIALAKARGYWLLALGELEQPARRPCLVLIGGLPGTGKSTLAAGLAARAGFTMIRSDAVRKELASRELVDRAPVGFGDGIYAADWTDRTYNECARRVEHALFEGGRVIVDASFRDDRRRQDFLRLAARCGVPAVLLICQASPDVIRSRLAARRNDPSDADWSIYERAAASWEQPSQSVQSHVHEIAAGGDLAESVQAALAELSSRQLFAS
jgi:uncharacterized protein